MRRVGLATGVLTDDEIEYLETQIVKTVRPMLVGRQVMPITSLAHAGFQSYTFYTETDMSQALIDMTGEEEAQDTVALSESNVAIPIIHKEYTLHWRDVLARRETGTDLNTQHAENAGRQVAEEEDKLILSGEYTGWTALGLEGLATATGRNTTAGGDWSANMLTYVAAAKAELRTDGYYGPYRLILRASWYAQAENIIANTEKWYFQAVGELIGGVENILISDNLYASDGGTDNALLVDVQPGNFSLVVGADLTNHMAQQYNMNYFGRVWEAVVPVIKRPEAICEITALT
jgi:uncharacterized linocin/CFP29 family protein